MHDSQLPLNPYLKQNKNGVFSCTCIRFKQYTCIDISVYVPVTRTRSLGVIKMRTKYNYTEQLHLQNISRWKKIFDQDLKHAQQIVCGLLMQVSGFEYFMVGLNPICCSCNNVNGPTSEGFVQSRYSNIRVEYPNTF